LRIGYRLSAVFVHEGYARALVGEAEILPAAFLALFLRRWRGLRHGVADDDRRAGGGSDGRGAAGRHQVGAAASATPWRTHPIAGGKVATPAAAATAADEVAGVAGAALPQRPAQAAGAAPAPPSLWVPAFPPVPPAREPHG
jgi:hypothetical protein